MRVCRRKRWTGDLWLRGSASRISSLTMVGRRLAHYTSASRRSWGQMAQGNRTWSSAYSLCLVSVPREWDSTSSLSWFTIQPNIRIALMPLFASTSKISTMTKMSLTIMKLSLEPSSKYPVQSIVQARAPTGLMAKKHLSKRYANFWAPKVLISNTIGS